MCEVRGDNTKLLPGEAHYRSQPRNSPDQRRGYQSSTANLLQMAQQGMQTNAVGYGIGGAANIHTPNIYSGGAR